MKITLSLKPAAAVVAVNTMNVVGTYSNWPRRHSELTENDGLPGDNRFDPVVLH